MSNLEVLEVLTKLGLRSATVEEARTMMDRLWPDTSCPLENIVCGLHEDGYDVISAQCPDLNPQKHGTCRYQFEELGTDNTFVFGPTNLLVLPLPDNSIFGKL